MSEHEFPYISIFPLRNRNRKKPALENRRLEFLDKHNYFMGQLMTVSDFLSMPTPEPDDRGFCLFVKVFYAVGRKRDQICAGLHVRKVEGGYLAYEHILDVEGRTPSMTIEQAINCALPFRLRDRMA